MTARALQNCMLKYSRFPLQFPARLRCGNMVEAEATDRSYWKLLVHQYYQYMKKSMTPWFIVRELQLTRQMKTVIRYHKFRLKSQHKITRNCMTTRLTAGAMLKVVMLTVKACSHQLLKLMQREE